MATNGQEIEKAEESSPFSYDSLQGEARVFIQQQTSEIKSLMRRTARDILEIGHRLKVVKGQLGHGRFQNWLRSEFEMSVSAANKFMQVHEHFQNVNFTDLQIALSALYLLAAPSTPSHARHKALARASHGENITYSKAKTIVRDCKSAKSRSRQTVDVSAQVIEAEKCTQSARSRVDRTALRQESKASREETLFRLWVKDNGSIIRLYRAEELEGNELKVGATVTIKKGRYQGQTARIQELLNNKALEADYAQEIALVKPIEPEKAANNQQIKINYSDLCVVLEGCPEDLISFCKRMHSDSQFAQEIIRQVNSSL